MRLLVSETKSGLSPSSGAFSAMGGGRGGGGRRWRSVCCLSLTLAESVYSAVSDGVVSASGENDEVVGGGVCSFEHVMSETRVDSRSGVVSE
eukprot:scaffold13222_cov122-Isochrysis_galbana.AAC.4